jgi:type II secretory pathway component PulM
MDALGDIKQLQQETKRKAQAIDKTVNPPMVADIQLKNQPASLLPGGVTYVTGFSSSGKPGFASVYEMKFPVGEITEDLNQVQDRIRKIFFNDIFQVISQYETRSNVSATEIDARRAEGMLMVGPVVERLMVETLPNCIDRTFAIASRKGLLPPPPPELSGGEHIDIEFVSMLAQAQEAAAAAGIERVFGMTGNIAGVDPAILDVVDYDYGVMKYSSLLNNDPKLIRSPDAIAAIRAQRQQQAQQQAMAQQAETASKLAGGAETLSQIDVGAGKSALQSIMGGP